MTFISSFPGRFRLDEATAERLVSRAVGADDAPPAYAPVARLLDYAAAAARPDEIEGEASAVAMFLAARSASPSTSAPRPGQRRRPLALTTKTAAAVVVGALLLTGGVAAAATGHLPDAVQGVAHDTFGHIGVSIPGVPTQADHGKDVKATTDDPTNTGEDKGNAVCTEASDGKCEAGRGDQADTTTTDSPGKPADPSASGNHAPLTQVPTGPPSGIPDPRPSDPSTTTTTHPSAGPPTSVPAGPPASVPAGRSGTSTSRTRS
jgi:hypothetical protein